MVEKRECPAIRVIMMPKDTNARGTIFGGVILSYIDQAAAIEAQRNSNKRFVTKAMNAVEFVAPVHLGDVVSFYASTIRLGRTSLTIKIEVEQSVSLTTNRNDPSRLPRLKWYVLPWTQKENRRPFEMKRANRY